ncbi:tRNA uridine-5-carboxymethylaminomethyl(34) synthesis GTPase MnmE [Metarhizobium album]|uniref:tRNA modification GTPase MnmE n=1 Tax=Metarhizobium album TaxID=2182425 RepID=A0A2U2DHC1_9HYPH|nr:tRNA uridine-5-carboxymethylaminomethyl(34) synthesis GTPase MnmE [Rhizobium album]PWE52725.1 tRNA uridine-5-carboxymethylaminomethyl(34) synthesis GTPase MnmE [Rhizobium album]
MRDTIFALSSGAPPAGVAVIRVSGTQAWQVFQAFGISQGVARRATRRRLLTDDGDLLDEAIVISFPAPYSFTGENCLELQIHGGRAVISAVLGRLSRIASFRLAEAGEFSRRAFENGKMDLVEIEGLADLIHAETEMQRRLAVEQSSGGLSALYYAWADRITRARALIEAELDFADEDDIPGSVSHLVWPDLEGLLLDVTRHLEDGRTAEIIRDGLKVVIAGPPNAGKSTLMNRLAERDVAIVTDVAGTTRDVLHVDLDMDGFSVRLYDTAGLRSTDDRIERIGIDRARIKIDEADIILYLDEIGNDSLSKQNFVTQAKILHIGTQADRHRQDDVATSYDLHISAATGQGLAELRQLLLSDVGFIGERAAFSMPARERQRQNLRNMVEDLGLALIKTNESLDIRAEYLRRASQALERMTGRIDVEDLLGVIFSEFCVGK